MHLLPDPNTRFDHLLLQRVLQPLPAPCCYQPRDPPVARSCLQSQQQQAHAALFTKPAGELASSATLFSLHHVQAHVQPSRTSTTANTNARPQYQCCASVHSPSPHAHVHHPASCTLPHQTKHEPHCERDHEVQCEPLRGGLPPAMMLYRQNRHSAADRAVRGHVSHVVLPAAALR